MNELIIMTLGLIIFAFILWISIGLRFISIEKKKILSKQEILRKHLSKRHNLIPLLINSAEKRVELVGEMKNGLIIARSRAMGQAEFNAEKIEFEHDLSEWLNNFFSFVEGNEEIKKNALFLEVNIKINEIEDRIEAISSDYSKVVMLFNKHISSSINMVSVFLLRVKRENIFEFEK
jgi:hypothetical protein